MSSLNQATQKSSNIAEIMQEIKGSNSKIKKIKIKLQNLTNNKIAQNLLNKNFSTIGELNIFL
ncbi:hypothetical protein HOG21_04540 [bacterium]|jgi:hypothetical protein|nr:hypothetical protein [bacterium]